MCEPDDLMSQDTFERRGGHWCPVCRSSHVEVEPGTLTADGEYASDHVTCGDCASAWREYFRCIAYGKLVVGDSMKDKPCAHCRRPLGAHDEEGQCPTPEPEGQDVDGRHEDTAGTVRLPKPEAEPRTEAQAPLAEAGADLGAETRLHGQRSRHRHEHSVYQPEYDQVLWEDVGFCSFMVFRTEEECRRVFPTLKPIRYEEHDIEAFRIVLAEDILREEVMQDDG